MAAIVVDAMQHFHRDRYLVTTWSVMPNHVHVILKLLAEHALRDVIRSLKRFTAREINTLLGREGTLWQEDYFDTLIRSEAHFLRAAEYVLGNPGVNGTNALATSEILGTAPYGHEGEWRAGL
jgi:REP element-mobilizing transposase RayT